jgi:soluble lytic murein transglycosylase-like protein
MLSERWQTTRTGDVQGFKWIILTALIFEVSALEAESTLIYQPADQTQAGKPSSISVYKYTNEQGVTSFSDRRPTELPYRVIRLNPDCYACNLDSTVDWHSTPLHLTSFQSAIKRAANRYDVDPALIRAVIHAESAFKPDAKSRVGALGLMQLMPGTAREMGVSDPLSPDQNIQGGVRYLAWLMQKTGGNITLATAAYNAGPGAVERHRGIPPFEETETYVRRVRILHDRYRKALSGST